MELQNIVVDFNDKTTTTMYQDKHYNVDVMSEIIPLRTQFELAYGIIFNRVVVQLTYDQSLSEPRVLCLHDFDTIIITIEDIKIKHPNLFNEMNRVKILIEEQIPNMVNN